MDSTIIYSIVGTLLAGFILLLVEYRTGFFVQSLSKLTPSKRLLAQYHKTSPIDNPQGDNSLNVAENIKNHVSELTKDQRNGHVELASVRKIDLGTELVFSYLGIDNAYYTIKVVADHNWRIQVYDKQKLEEL